MTLKEVGIIAKGEIFNKRTAEKYLKYFFRSVELLFEQLNPHDYQITSLQRCSTLDKWVFKKNKTPTYFIYFVI
jgi:thioredoxin-related protein